MVVKSRTPGKLAHGIRRLLSSANASPAVDFRAASVDGFPGGMAEGARVNVQKASTQFRYSIPRDVLAGSRLPPQSLAKRDNPGQPFSSSTKPQRT